MMLRQVGKLNEVGNGVQPPGRRVLVVDDDPDFAESLYTFLTLEGYEVGRAHNAEQALEAIKHFDAQIAILDYRLGPTNGVDLVEPLKRHRPGVVCILATAHAELDSAIKALRHGVYDYFGKPLNTDELLATLDRCFDKLRLEDANRIAEDALRTARKMKAVAQVAGGVALHSNNLLTVILANMERLRLCVQGDRYALAVANELERAVDRAADLNRSLLTFTRQSVLRPEPIDVATLIAEVSELIRPDLDDAIQVKVEFQSDLSGVSADAAQLKATLLALAQNAVEAMPQGGTLTFKASNLDTFDAERGAGHASPVAFYVAIAVADTGIGMEPEVVERAFEPFFSQKGLAEKMGLGLSMAYGFAAQSGGHITLESEPARGTTARLCLPRSAQTPGLD